MSEFRRPLPAAESAGFDPDRFLEVIAEHDDRDLALYAHAAAVMQERLDEMGLDVPSISTGTTIRRVE